MDFGIPTLIENENLEDCIKLCCELKLKFVEINLNFPQYQLELLNAEELNKYKEKYGIYFTIHADENLNIADFNEKIANAYKETMLDTISLAKKIGIPVITIHLAKGIHVTLPHKRVYLFHEYFDYYIKNIKSFRDMCQKAIGNSNIKICIENTNGFLEHEKKAIELLLESQCFMLTLDIGHNHCTDYMDEEFIMKHKDKLCHMHMHDAKGKADHLTLFDGEIDMKEKLSLAKECNCRVVLETKTIDALKKSVEKLTSIL